MSPIAEPHMYAQEARPLRGIFVAGSGTDVGKTVCTGALLRCLRQENVAVQAVKPVQTGVRADDVASSPLSDAFVYAKAMQGIKSMQGLQPSAVLHCFELPASPHLAAAKENKRLSCRSLREDILAHWRAVPARALLLEGAGGLRVPLNDDEDILDLMSMLGLPVLLAGGNYLGGLNHILLSVEALRHHGLVLAGVALTPTADPAMNCPGVDVAGLLADNARILRKKLEGMDCAAPVVELPRLEKLDWSGWERLTDLLRPIALQMAQRWSEKGQGSLEFLEQERLIQRDRKTVWHPYASATDVPPLNAVSHTFANRMVLADGEELVDGMSSWWAAIHGYNHPRLLDALHSQAGRMPHVMFGGLTHEPAVALAEHLLEFMPDGLDRVFFADSGSVAVEVALKMALQYQQSRGESQRTRFLAPRGGYHGDTIGAMSVCDPVTGMHSLFSGILPRQLFMERPSCRFDQPFDPACLDDARRMFAEHGKELAAVILEPVVQGAGGMWFYHPEYLRELVRLCRQADTLLIFDEIATGFGRTGKMFAAEWAEVSPDILCCGKGLTGGMLTLAATACSRQVAEGICRDDGVFMHGPTFMANALACAVAGASLDMLASGDWRKQVDDIELALREGLAGCQGLPDVVDVRVLGAIGVVEMRDPVNTRALQHFFVEHGVWLRPFNHLIYLMPPYVTPVEDVAQLCAAVEKALHMGVYLL
ncbi:MAG: adenosylmethionine--8-amino-7-oxononanoate transaminase [Desulfovibrio sp.]|uniref:adenosylmethionine--8-amino-7-oxononanoate transaminase n=1 Tax=Desulfovibrio sp. TaxID=885 RepID=UPI002A35A6BA|nr:adenosylmethionine--8-amino-7-oxononanoate transaminase [Desulfovibrio sp.]MDY0258359.1 adenosylmethionine--8-amino-7-oxononanoate transaminase [Desulfovibrio sp.]